MESQEDHPLIDKIANKALVDPTKMHYDFLRSRSEEDLERIYDKVSNMPIKNKSNEGLQKNR